MWFKVDDAFPRHPKTRAAARTLGGKHAKGRVMGFWLEAGTFCSEFLTDGRISDDEVADLQADDDPVAVAQALVTSGLWLRVQDGYQFHDWDHHQPSAESVLDKRDRDRARKRSSRTVPSPKDSARTPSGFHRDGALWLPSGLRAESAQTPDGVQGARAGAIPTRPDPTIQPDQDPALRAADAPLPCAKRRPLTDVEELLSTKALGALARAVLRENPRHYLGPGFVEWSDEVKRRASQARMSYGGDRVSKALAAAEAVWRKQA